MFEPQTDFQQVADGLEKVTLLPANGPSVTITGALRRVTNTSEPAPSLGKATEHDCVWHLPVSQLPHRPELGSRLRDAAGEQWTLLAVDHRVLAGRWQCRTRNLTLAHDLAQRIQIESPVPTKGMHGACERSWQTVASDIPARVQPEVREPEMVDGAAQDLALFVILVAAWESYSAQVRVRDARGRVFEVLRIQRAERLGELIQLRVRQIA